MFSGHSSWFLWGVINHEMLLHWVRRFEYGCDMGPLTFAVFNYTWAWQGNSNEEV